MLASLDSQAIINAHYQISAREGCRVLTLVTWGAQRPVWPQEQDSISLQLWSWERIVFCLYWNEPWQDHVWNEFDTPGLDGASLFFSIQDFWEEKEVLKAFPHFLSIKPSIYDHYGFYCCFCSLLLHFYVSYFYNYLLWILYGFCAVASC